MQKQVGLIVSLFVVFFTSAQKKVQIEVLPKNAEVGETFSITITSSIPGHLNFDNVPDVFIQDYNVQRGSKRTIDHISGTMQAAYYYTFTGMMTKAGKYNFGPVYIVNGNKSYASNQATITIGEKVPMQPGGVSSKQLQDPAFGIIQTNKKTIYEGEPLLVSCKIYAQYDPTHVGAYKSYGISQTTKKHAIGNNTTTIKHQIETFKGREYYTFDYDKNIIFPANIGAFHIGPFSMNLHQGYESFPIISGDFDVDVLPLPGNPPSDFIGGVGKFSIEKNINTKEIKQGEVLNLKVTISGSGNLQDITAPELNLPEGLTVYGDPIINEKYVIDINGAEGEVEFEYNVQAKNAGTTRLPSTSISFFDPQQKKYLRVSTKDLNVDVIADLNFIANEKDETTPQQNNLIVHRSEIRKEVSTKKPTTFFGTTAFWSFLTLPFLSSFLFLFITKKRGQFERKAHTKRHRTLQMTQLKSQIELAKSDLTSDTDRQFYLHVENTLQKAFEIKMDLSSNQTIDKRDILEFVDDEEQKEKIRSIFSECEQAKYGFSPEKKSRLETMRNLKAIVYKLNIIK
ncbi:BatD family protein [Crocinitomicaceae bacterium]|nr:BatD family protein [Crocinitomicaceae bacterium]